MPHLSTAFLKHWLTRILQWLAEPQGCDELQLHRNTLQPAESGRHKKSG